MAHKSRGVRGQYENAPRPPPPRVRCISRRKRESRARDKTSGRKSRSRGQPQSESRRRFSALVFLFFRVFHPRPVHRSRAPFFPSSPPPVRPARRFLLRHVAGVRRNRDSAGFVAKTRREISATAVSEFRRRPTTTEYYIPYVCMMWYSRPISTDEQIFQTNDSSSVRRRRSIPAL